eukprot:m51a1_g9680 hypothetical protein (786) ;mRNA; r:1293568-1296515
MHLPPRRSLALAAALLLCCAPPVRTDSAADLYVSAGSGDDSNDGRSAATAFRTIAKASEVATAGTTVHVADGLYRESVVPLSSGRAGAEVVYRADGGRAYLLGSLPGSSLRWSLSPGTADVWQADVTGVDGLQSTPRFVAVVDRSAGRDPSEGVQLLRLAREPNHRHWNSAEGGSAAAHCDPAAKEDCDKPTWSARQLTDSKFKALGDLVGATIVTTGAQSPDCWHRTSGHDVYRRKITAVDSAAGTVTLDADCEWYAGAPSLGALCSWYVENKRQFLDDDGEFFYDAAAKTLLVKKANLNPDSLEISTDRLKLAFDLSSKSYVRLQNLRAMFYSDAAVYEGGGWDADSQSSLNVTIERCKFFYCNNGVKITRGAENPSASLRFWTIADSEMGFIDTQALSAVVGVSATPSPHVGASDFAVTGSYFHDLGFNSDNVNRVGMGFENAKGFRLLNNTIARTSHTAFIFAGTAVTAAGETYSGSILVRGNTFDAPCMGNADCGCLKFWADDGSHRWRDVLVAENVCTNSVGWTKTAALRNLWGSGGYIGYGIYTDGGGGFTFWRNAVLGASSGSVVLVKNWQDSDNYVYNNLLVGSGSSIGLTFKGTQQTGVLDIKNNVLLDTIGDGIHLETSQSEKSKVLLNNNLYHGINAAKQSWSGLIHVEGSEDKCFDTFGAAQAYNPAWETTQYSFDPRYGPYPPFDSTVYDQRNHPRDFDIRAFAATQPLVDKGAELPQAVRSLLARFGVCDDVQGSTYDLGPFEKDSRCGTWMPGADGSGRSSSVAMVALL